MESSPQSHYSDSSYGPGGVPSQRTLPAVQVLPVPTPNPTPAMATSLGVVQDAGSEWGEA